MWGPSPWCLINENFIFEHHVANGKHKRQQISLKSFCYLQHANNNSHVNLYEISQT